MNFWQEFLSSAAIIAGVGLIGLDDASFLVTMVGVILLMGGLDYRYVERQ